MLLDFENLSKFSVSVLKANFSCFKQTIFQNLSSTFKTELCHCLSLFLSISHRFFVSISLFYLSFYLLIYHSICLCIILSTYISFYLLIYHSINLSITLSTSIILSQPHSVYQYISLPTYVSFYLNLSQSIHLSDSDSIWLSISHSPVLSFSIFYLRWNFAAPLYPRFGKKFAKATSTNFSARDKLGGKTFWRLKKYISLFLQ